MLLNQCLAISVSASTANNQKYEPEARKTEINQSNAFNVFLQLVDQNSPQAQAADVQPAGPVVNFKLNEVFKRVEFAGFVVPSWLLLSGTYNDLHCIKSHWASGQLRAPSGLRLETIGNIRSVNVDYFGEQQQPAAGRLSRFEMKRTSGELSTWEQKVLSATSWLSSTTARRTNDEGIKLMQLTEFMADKWPSQDKQQRVTQELVEKTSRALARRGRLELRHAEEAGHLLVRLPQVVTVPVDSTPSPLSGRNSASSAKSKSTTLDSGLGGSGAIARTLHKNDDDDEEEVEPSGQVAIVEKASESSSSILSRLRMGRSASRGRRDDLSPEPPVGMDTNEDPKRRRGFSLTRSFSFKQRPSAEQQQQQLSLACSTAQGGAQATAQQVEQCKARLAMSEIRRRQLENSSSNSQAPPTPSGINKQNANFSPSSLFRSKSMRVVSSSPRPRLANETATNFHCDTDQRHQDNLPSRARSRATRNAAFQQQQAPIDYLGGCDESLTSHHKRSFSMRRDSLLAFGKEELGGGRIAMFLRKLFSLRRVGARRPATDFGLDQDEDDVQDAADELRPRRASPAEGAPKVAGRIQVDIHHHHQPGAGQLAQCRACSHCARRAEGDTDNTQNSFLFKSQHSKDIHDTPVSPHNSLRDQDERASLSPSQSSLIEILDCSRSMERTRRGLRQEDSLSGAARATWRLIERSESSLSQHSNASSSTNKSTVSQQLRRHLDEAYKRHRKCTSKREKDFIDSINVLRQASRHASLQNSRSSSKNRRHRRDGAGMSAQASKTNPNDNCKSGSSSSQTTSRGRSANSSDLEDSTTFTSPDVCSSRTGSSQSPPVHEEDEGLGANSQCQESGERAQDQVGELPAAYLINNQQQRRPGDDVTNQHHQGRWPASGGCPSLGCCCLLAVGSSQQQLEHTAELPPYKSSQFLPTQSPFQTPACCLAFQRLAHHNAALAVSLDPLLPILVDSSSERQGAANQAQAQAPAHPLNNQLLQLALQPTNTNHDSQGLGTLDSTAASNELCCPIWRSMLTSYCQQQIPLPPLGQLPFNVIGGAPPSSSLSGGESPAKLGALDAVYAAALSSLHNSMASQQDQRPARVVDCAPPSSFHSSSTQLSSSNHHLQQQQQQHNTTIDLKIEIGADFAKPKLASRSRGSSSTPRLTTRVRQHQPVQLQSGSSSEEDASTDSLDENPASSEGCDELISDESSASAPTRRSSAESGQNSRRARRLDKRGEPPTSDMPTSCEDESLQSNGLNGRSGAKQFDSLAQSPVECIPSGFA